jgi:RNA polymerase sigma-70 factor (ECF subfamily)
VTVKEQTTLDRGAASKLQELDLETTALIDARPFASDTPKDQPRAVATQGVDEFAEIYETNKARIYSTAYRMLGNSADAEDVVQDVFIKAYRKLDTFEGRSQLSTWLYRITINRCLDILRKRKRQQTAPLDEAMGAVAKQSNLMKLIEGMIPSLPPGYRTVFVLHDIQGLKHYEIAKQLHITEGACKSQLHKARLMMRKKLAPYLEGLR